MSCPPRPPGSRRSVSHLVKHSPSLNRSAQDSLIPAEFPFTLIRTLGEGASGKVFLARNPQTNQDVAVKAIRREGLTKRAKKRVKKEIKVLQLLDHPHIVDMLAHTKTSKSYLMITEYVAGGQLLDYVVDHDFLSEDQTRVFFRQIVSAIGYCHTLLLAHRDLKLENIMLYDNASKVKVIDFGFTCAAEETKLLSTFCGTPGYTAPEIVQGTEYCGLPADMWSLGIILYTMACGCMPFDGSTRAKMSRRIVRGTYKVPPTMSSGMVDLLSRMLHVDPTERATIEEVSRHPWVLQGYDYPVDFCLPSPPSPASLECSVAGLVMSSCEYSTLSSGTAWDASSSESSDPGSVTEVKALENHVKRKMVQAGYVASHLAAIEEPASLPFTLRKVRGPYSVAAVTTQSPLNAIAVVSAVLNDRGIHFDLQAPVFTVASGFDMQFTIEVCRIKSLEGVLGLRIKRLNGSSSAFKTFVLNLIPFFGFELPSNYATYADPTPPDSQPDADVG